MVKVTEYRCSVCKKVLEETDTMCAGCLTLNPKKVTSTKYVLTEEERKEYEKDKKKKKKKKWTPFIFSENYILADILKEIRYEKNDGEYVMSFILFILFISLIVLHVFLGMIVLSLCFEAPWCAAFIAICYIVFRLI